MEKKWSIQPPHPNPLQYQYNSNHTPTSSSSSYSNYFNGHAYTNPAAELQKHKRQKKQQQQLRLKCIVLGAAGAGKTSILRRLVHDTFDLHRDSTLGADFYTYRMKNPLLLSLDKNNNDDENDYESPAAPPQCDPRQEEERSSQQQKQHHHEYISLQLWDTAGKERNFKNGRNKPNNKNRGKVPSLGDAFFRHADVAMLVYDATSSVSFMQLIRWHSELITRLSECYNDSGEDEEEELDDEKQKQQQQQQPKMIPVLVVANKQDRVRMELSKPIRKKIVPQRDVMGLQHKFKGKDRMYEYSVTTLPQQQQQQQQQQKQTNTNTNNNSNGNELNASTTTDKSTSNGREALTYNMTDSEWSTDYSYLNSVMTAEDGSLPDQDMVLLWCRRNGLKHVEVSALDGTGLKSAIELLVTQALESIMVQQQQQQHLEQQQQQQRRTNQTATNNNNGHSHQQKRQDEYYSTYQHRKREPLDFHKRYAAKDDGRSCCWQLIPFC